MWKQERSWEKAESDKWCMRGHRTTQEAKTCNGTVKPVFELSDPPRVVPRSSGTKKASYRLRPRSETYLSYNMRKNNQRYVPISPKPKPRSMGKVYHFKAANSNPRATVQMHPIPEASVVHQERGCPLYRPSQPTIQVVGDGPVQSPMELLTPKAHHSLIESTMVGKLNKIKDLSWVFNTTWIELMKQARNCWTCSCVRRKGSSSSSELP